MILGIDDIMRALPHRYPFLMVDKVLELEKGKSITATKMVTATEPHFQGHFPNMPIMPGVLIVNRWRKLARYWLFYPPTSKKRLKTPCSF